MLYRKTTRRAQFLVHMHQVVPWATVRALIEPHCRKDFARLTPARLEQMLRIYYLQHWFDLSDAAAEEALHDSVAMREFAGIDLPREAVPGQYTIRRFRLLLEHRGLGRQLQAAVSQLLRGAGLKLSIGAIVDPGIVSAPRWTRKNTVCVARNAGPEIVSEAAPL